MESTISVRGEAILASASSHQRSKIDVEHLLEISVVLPGNDGCARTCMYCGAEIWHNGGGVWQDAAQEFTCDPEMGERSKSHSAWLGNFGWVESLNLVFDESRGAVQLRIGKGGDMVVFDVTDAVATLNNQPVEV